MVTLFLGRSANRMALLVSAVWRSLSRLDNSRAEEEGERGGGAEVSIFSSCDIVFSHSRSEEEGLRANWEVGREEKEEASSGNSVSDVNPPNSKMAMEVTGSVGGAEGLVVSMRGREWNSKLEVGEGERETYRQLQGDNPQEK